MKLNSIERLLTASLCLAAGLPSPEKHFDEDTLQQAEDRYSSGIKLKQFLNIAALKNGYHDADGFNVDLNTQRAAFGQLHASFSTVDAGGILSATANRFLLSGWESGDFAWKSIAQISAVQDFKESVSYRLGADATYRKVGPTGEIQHGTLSETAYRNQAETFGRMFGLSRTDIINDDLGAFTQIPQQLGIGAVDALNDAFWTEFLDNSTFFHSNNANVSTGAGSALSLAGIQAAEAVMAKQTRPNGLPLNVTAKKLLVPVELKETAISLMTSERIITGESKTLGDVNTVRGRFEVVSSPYLSNAHFTGNSSTAWYLLADPARLATIGIVFLNGQERPIIETASADFNQLGVQFRGYHDFGVRKQEPRGGVRSAGS